LVKERRSNKYKLTNTETKSKKEEKKQKEKDETATKNLQEGDPSMNGKQTNKTI
jgi:hypothetical protein